MSRRILLADDSVTIQKVIELTFMDDDYEVRAVGNGDEALAMLTALKVDFVIADVHMPGATGYDVCRRSKQLQPQVPVLLLVGTFEPFDEAQARECGADSFLKKPFDSQELLGRVHDLLGGSQAPAQAAAAPPAPSFGAATAPLPPKPSAVPGAPAAGFAPAPAPAAAAAPVEPAESWQEFELEAEPMLVPEPRSEWPPARSGAPAAPVGTAAAAPLEQPFALGDLEEHDEQVAEPLPVLAPLDPLPPLPPLQAPPPLPQATAGGAAAAGAAPASPSGAAFGDQPFTLGGLDERAFELDDAPPEPGRAERLTQAEPVPPPLWMTPPPAPPAAPAIEERAGAPLGQSPSTASLAATEEQAAVADAARPEALEPPAAFPPPPPPALAAPGAASAPAAVTALAEGNNGHPVALPPAGAAITEAEVERIARRVVELIGDRVVRDIAWEVIPDLAEMVIKDRLRELESQVE
jgi:CheY-like chemotaxis protein